MVKAVKANNKTKIHKQGRNENTKHILNPKIEISKDFEIVYKKWHISPDNNPLGSTQYPSIKWKDVNDIFIGIATKKLKFKLQYYHHPINAIAYATNSKGETYEIALKLSKNKATVTDVSFLKIVE